jgi:malonyl-CoA O-methyltransferase
MKEKIRRNFSKAADRYWERATFQREAGRELLARLALIGEKTPLLDLGSGSGELTEGMEGVVCLDISLEMAKLCRSLSKEAVCADGEALPFKDGVFSTVISNFSLQWMDLERTFGEVHRVLKRGGFFIASLPVEGSLKSLFECWKRSGSRHPLFKFPEERSVFNALKGFKLVEFKRVWLKKRFPSAKEAVKAITGIGAKNPFGIPRRRSEILKFLELYDKNPLVEYRVLIITAQKEEKK